MGEDLLGFGELGCAGGKLVCDSESQDCGVRIFFESLALILCSVVLAACALATMCSAEGYIR